MNSSSTVPGPPDEDESITIETTREQSDLVGEVQRAVITPHQTVVADQSTL